MIAKGCPNADADFIAHARIDIPALVAELRAARAAIDELEAKVAEQDPHYPQQRPHQTRSGTRSHQGWKRPPCYDVNAQA
jgi:hypothetical protein